MTQQVDIKSYLKVFQRRKWLFIVPMVLIFLVTVCVALALPSIYKSEATILVEAQEIPEQMVQSTVTGYIEERIQSINQVVLSRANLLQIVERYNLYTKMRQTSTTEEIIAKMRNDISMTPVHAEVSNPESGRTGMATIAFTLSYEGKVPKQVAQVTNTLVSLFLEENAEQREKKAQTTVDFLQDQITNLENQISILEQEIADFKDEHLLALPDLMNFNLQLMHRLESQIDQKKEQIRNLEDRLIYLKGQLATLEPVKYSVSLDGERSMTLEEELKMLKGRFMTLKADHSDHHPDVVRLNKQITALEQENEVKDELRQVRKDLVQNKAELSQLEKRYSDKHPDVIKTSKRVQSLEAKASDLEKKQNIFLSKDEDPDNPSYINLQTQVESTKMDIASLRQEVRELTAKHAKIQSRVEKTPKVEQQYNQLKRDYDNARAKYQETQARLMSAREAKDLEQDQISQKLTLIDPPAIPEQPFKPNRLALLLVGAVLALGFGVGTGSASEFLDNSLHTPQNLAAMTTCPVLTSIPYLQTIKEHKIRRRRMLFVILAVFGLMVGALLAVHLFFRPLGVIWIQIQQKLQFMF